MAGSESKHRILVVDDDPQVLGLLRITLMAAGYDVGSANDGKGATSLLGTGSFSLLITDLLMPGPNGLEILRDLRSQGSTLPVIIFSGSVDEEVRKETALLGNADCLEKPLRTPELLAVLKRLLG